MKPTRFWTLVWCGEASDTEISSLPVRLASIFKIAELLEKLSGEAKIMVDQIDGGLAQVKEVAEVVKKAAEEPVKRIIARGVSVKPITLGGPATQEQKK